MDGLANYWEHGFPYVDGWVDARLLESLTLIGKLQSEIGIKGQAGEIGVYHGKFLIALANLIEEGGSVVALDVFEDQSKNLDGAGVGSEESLRRNIELFGPKSVNWDIIKIDSITMSAYDKVRIKEKYGPFRLFSVDGCHTAEHTFNDLLTGQDMIGSGGVMILDDYMQPHWPGVTDAVHMFYNRSVPRVKPFLYHCHKLFFVGYGWHEAFLQACADRFSGREDARLTKMFGSPVLTLYP